MKVFLPWQAQQWQQLQRAREQGRMPHALLLSGAAKTGKRQFAEALGQSLLCVSPRPEHLACGECPSCRLILGGTHADLAFLEPEEPGKQLKIDAIREFTGSEALSSQRGGFKIRIIDPADAMNRAAANALLKTLEEPSPNSLLLLISAQPGLLPATIRSRCQQINFPLPETEQALAWLGEQAAEDWRTLLSVAAGAPLKALELAAEGVMAQRSSLLEELLALLAGRADPIELAEAWSKRDVEQLLGWLASLLMDLMRLQLAVEASLFNPDQLARLRPLAQSKSARHWHQAMQQLIEVRKSITSQLNLQLQLERLLISLVGVSNHP
ncbi:MAG: DNA polymerase III subunit delta' [Gammaproteobacteria bacterium]|nr:DNA polymerase III subunit delta' [Gammaproteobacteria bacterium]